MKVIGIARFLGINGSVEGVRTQERRFDLPRERRPGHAGALIIRQEALGRLLGVGLRSGMGSAPEAHRSLTV